MPILEQNFDQQTLELISMNTIVDGIFKPDVGHYFRMAVYNNDGELVKQYYSNRTYDGKLIHWSVSATAYYDVTVAGESTTLSYPVQFDDLHLPIYYENDGRYFLKPNDTLSKDPDISSKFCATSVVLSKFT